VGAEEPPERPSVENRRVARLEGRAGYPSKEDRAFGAESEGLSERAKALLTPNDRVDGRG